MRKQNSRTCTSFLVAMKTKESNIEAENTRPKHTSQYCGSMIIVIAVNIGTEQEEIELYCIERERKED